jgi:hypothetical protein
MLMSSRRTNAPGKVTSWRRSNLPRVSGEDFGHLRKKSLEIIDTECVKCNGAIKLKKELLGKKKINIRQSFQKSFPISLNLEGKIHPKGGRFVTPCFS